MKILFNPYKPRRRQNLEGYILRLYEEDPWIYTSGWAFVWMTGSG